MKVKELKAQLENYKDEDNLLVLYWDKEYGDNYSSQVSGELSNEQWLEVVTRVEGRPMWQIDDIGDIISDAIDEVTQQEESKWDRKVHDDTECQEEGEGANV